MTRSDYCRIGLCGRCRGVDHNSKSCTHHCHGRPDLPLEWCSTCRRYCVRPHLVCPEATA